MGLGPKIAMGVGKVQRSVRRWLTACFLLTVMAVGMAWAQRNPVDPLTPDQQSKIAEAGIDPDARIGLYTKFLKDDADVIERLVHRTERGRDRMMDEYLQRFSALIEELSSNLDEYGDRKADLRKSLKTLDESVPRWQQLVKSLPAGEAYQVSRADATDSLSDLADQTRQLTADQQTYFKEHKKAKGQEREEPE
jgi:hypothetical protein